MAKAILSPSSAYRWIECTPSAMLETKFRESGADKGSVSAEEGTLAHHLAATRLRLWQGEITKRKHNSEFRKAEKHERYSEDMPAYVDQYVEYVQETFAEVQAKDPNAVILIEEKLDFSHILERGFGVGDTVIIGNGILIVIDFKYGQGQEVSAENNPQLNLYALGAINEYESFYEFSKIKAVIYQPRMENYSETETTEAELKEWAKQTLIPAAEKAIDGKGVQKQGEHCRFCNVRGTCATLAAANIKLARHDFKDPHLLSNEQLLDVFKQLPMLLFWAKGVEKHMETSALAGKTWPGYKLVEKKTNRKWVDAEKVGALLTELGYAPEKFTDSKIKGLTAIEQLLGKPDFNKTLSEHITKPVGLPTLVPESDKRPAITNAENDFNDDDLI